MRTLLLFICFLFAPLLAAETVHEVRMLNMNETGPMPFEPDYLEINPGDSIRFIPEDRGHNVATIRGFIPEGATRFISKIDEDFTTQFTVEGWYGLRCAPHYSMAMVMLVKVGNPSADLLIIPDGVPAQALERFNQIIANHVNNTK
jgi:pseudoazurin